MWLKEGLVDAEGKSVEEALKDLGYRVSSVRVGKVYTFYVKAKDKVEAEKLVEEICIKLLSNPVRDYYSYKVEELNV